MLFSELFGINYDERMEWYDPILTIDTKLFIDPFLLYEFENKITFFSGSHSEIISFFNIAFETLARFEGTKNEYYLRKALSMLIFPEIHWLCLGYSSSGVKGAGTGKGFAEIMANAISETIRAGKTNIQHFEEISILREGIGADRISDTVANIIMHRLCSYTNSICVDFNIQTSKVKIRNGRFDTHTKMWKPIIVNLPINKNNNTPILLCPKIFLNELPKVRTNDFWDYCGSYENEILRQQFGDDIKARVRKAEIIKFARKNPSVRERYLEFVEKEGANPYDFKKDSLGQVRWYSATKLYFREKDLHFSFCNVDEFANFIEFMLKQFKNYVENQGGWKLLWNDNGREKTEEACQRLFLGVLYNYCRANNVDLSGEANIGRGPVDFKASQGFGLRALFELKKANNTKFWNGVEHQLPKYLESENISAGYFVVFVFSDKDAIKLKDIEQRVKKSSENTGRILSYKVIDARKPLSASKL